jgi:hypothetical protein
VVEEATLLEAIATEAAVLLDTVITVAEEAFDDEEEAEEAFDEALDALDEVLLVEVFEFARRTILPIRSAPHR